MRFKAEWYALEVLDAQYSYIARDAQGLPIDIPGNAEQLSYYDGLKKAFDIVLSDAYATPVRIEADKHGHHSIVEGKASYPGRAN